jgi:hypothetical protein
VFVLMRQLPFPSVQSFPKYRVYKLGLIVTIGGMNMVYTGVPAVLGTDYRIDGGLPEG